MFYNGSETADGGTSASAPVVAGMVGLLNDARLRSGRPAMGFINPWLYRLTYRTGLTDILEGSTPACNGLDPHGRPLLGGGVIPFAAWNCTPGWDPVTGLGAPNFMEMLRSSKEGI